MERDPWADALMFWWRVALLAFALVAVVFLGRIAHSLAQISHNVANDGIGALERIADALLAAGGEGEK